jgi:hypothetical protein
MSLTTQGNKRKKPKKVKRLTRTVPPKKGPDSQGIDITTN